MSKAIGRSIPAPGVWRLSPRAQRLLDELTLLEPLREYLVVQIDDETSGAFEFGEVIVRERTVTADGRVTTRYNTQLRYPVPCWAYGEFFADVEDVLTFELKRAEVMRSE